ncbi:MAG: hypothetical protein ACYST2_00885 [Planctomycetota bacterium]|jgi:hypothetical protein
MLPRKRSTPKPFNICNRDFAICWDNIAQEKDDNLSVDAQELNQKIVQPCERHIIFSMSTYRTREINRHHQKVLCCCEPPSSNDLTNRGHELLSTRLQ